MSSHASGGFSKLFIGYFPESGVHAVLDATLDNADSLQAELYRRVQGWTQSHGVLLGEGYSWRFTSSSSEHPESMGLKAPVLKTGSLELNEVFFELVD